MSTFVERTSRYTGGTSGKELIVRNGVLTLAGEGAVVADCPASVFGLTKLAEVSTAIKTDNSQIAVFAVSADGGALLALNVEAGTDADRANPADLTGAFVLTVTGY